MSLGEVISLHENDDLRGEDCNDDSFVGLAPGMMGNLLFRVVDGVCILVYTLMNVEKKNMVKTMIVNTKIEWRRVIVLGLASCLSDN